MFNITSHLSKQDLQDGMIGLSSITVSKEIPRISSQVKRKKDQPRPSRAIGRASL
jgi:hypothetical protein